LLKGSELAKDADKTAKKRRRCRNQIRARDPHGRLGGGKKAQRPTNRSGPISKEYTSKVLGLESHTFDVGNAKYTAKFQKSVDATAIHIQCEYLGRPDIANAIRDLVLPSMNLPPYPTGTRGNPPVLGEIYLWQQSITETNKRKLLTEGNI
jgi:hypothetical protein